MNHLRNLQGNRYGRLTVLCRAPNKGEVTMWKVRCDCGTEKDVRRTELCSGHTNSCGCLQKEKAAARNTRHGHAANNRSTATYAAWGSLRARCERPKDKAYKDYGGRGITVCKRWSKFENFLTDMGERPDGLTLERKNNDKGYCKSNCRWATAKEQAHNRRNNVWLTVGTLTMCATDWAEALGTTPSRIQQRTAAGWPTEMVCTYPVMKQYSNKRHQ